MDNTTDTLADFVANISYESLPTEAIERVKRQCTDLIGVALVGSKEPVGEIASQYALRFRSAPEATIWGAGARTSPPEAAFANGVAGHATDFDDVWLPGSHPTAPIFSAAFAVAESIGASGKELLAAQLAGYEIMGRLNSAVNGRAGWHPTGVFGALGAAAACARLLHLSPEKTSLAFGIGSSSASGVDAHNGTMTKPFHAGNAARNGVTAAMLAADGFTANDAIFDADPNFYSAFFRDMVVQTWRLTADLGETYYILSPGIGLKMVPAGYHMHQPFEAALQIVTEHNIVPEEVKEVVIGIRPNSNFNRPEIHVGLEGKFSFQYMAALAIIERGLTVQSFDDEVARSDEVQSMLRKIRVQVDRSIPNNPDIWYNPVSIETTDGRVYSAAVALPRSHWRYPLSRSEWVGKFNDNAKCVLTPSAVDELRDSFDHLEEVADVRTIGTLLTEGRA